LREALATPARLPDDPQAWLAMSELGDKFGRHAYADQIAQAAIQRFHSAETYAWAAQMKARNGDGKSARVLLRKALDKAPSNTHLRLAYASLLSESGDHAGASRLLRHGAQSAQIYALRAGLAAREHNEKDLEQLYQELKRAKPDVREKNAFLLGQLAEMQHHQDAALSWYGQVTDEDPHAFDADLRSALILFAQGHKSEAHQLLGQLQLDYLDQPEQLQQAWQVDAELYVRERNYTKAETAFSRALQVVPNDPGLLYGRGLTYAEAGQIDLAIKDFHRLLKIKQAWAARQDADVGIHLGEVLWAQGDKQRARQVFDQVRKLDPHSTALTETLKRLDP
jgi:tetratricopeptide (TPR) repeat protein